MRDQRYFHAPAKLNLALHVTGRRADGRHLLESLVVFTRFGDRLEACPSAEDSFVVTGPFAATTPRDGSNLVVKARDLLRTAYPQPTCPPVAIRLEKNLPPTSGVGGGSSDAAATVRLLAHHWGLPSDGPEMTMPFLALGADLPMCLAARPLMARGIGELITTLPHLPALPIVLANAAVEVSTALVFARLAKRDNGPLPEFGRPTSVGMVCDWLATTRNDLEKPASGIAPVIHDTLEALRRHGAMMARMSGSGATCFGVFQSDEEARQAAAAIAGARPGWFVAATTTFSSQEDIDG